VLCGTKCGELYIENSIIMQRPPHVFVSQDTRDLVAKFGAIPDLFEGGPSSTKNYRAKSRGNLINLKKVPNEFQKISPSFLALNFHVLVLKIEFVNQIQKERKSGKTKIVNEI
jgi:hypothetical protein